MCEVKLVGLGVAEGAQFAKYVDAEEGGGKDDRGRESAKRQDDRSVCWGAIVGVQETDRSVFCKTTLHLLR
jgi:hypothetical protein